MPSIAKESLHLATQRFEAFGLKPEQIQTLLDIWQKDFDNELSILAAQLTCVPSDLAAIDRSLHALKGLLHTAGNLPAGDRFDALRTIEDRQELTRCLQALLPSYFSAPGSSVL